MSGGAGIDPEGEQEQALDLLKLREHSQGDSNIYIHSPSDQLNQEVKAFGPIRERKAVYVYRKKGRATLSQARSRGYFFCCHTALHKRDGGGIRGNVGGNVTVNIFPADPARARSEKGAFEPPAPKC